MPLIPLLITAFTAIFSFIGSVLKGVSSYALILYKFLITVVPKILRWGFLSALLFFSYSLIVFTVYHLVYGMAIGLSPFVTLKTINILLYSSYGYFLYLAYVFLYKN